MNKADILQKLIEKFYKVETPSPQQTYGNLKYYLIKVYDVTGEALRDANIAFYVENEGEVDEAAYWSPSEPKPERMEGFDAKLQAYLNSRIADGTVEGAFVEVSNPALENAVVKVVMDVSGVLTEKRLFLDRDAEGNVRHRVIG